MLPLVVALPMFFVLYSLMQGWTLVAVVEDGWDSGNGNVWEALTTARQWVWVLALFGGGCGLAWAWIILLPVKRYKNQIDRMLQQGTAGKIEVEEEESEFAYLAASFNRLMEEIGKSLPEKVQAILSSVTSGVVLLDSGGRIERANPCASRILKMNSGNHEGQDYKSALSCSEELVTMVEKALSTQSDYPPETIHLTNEYGQTRKVKVWLAWVRGSEGHPVTLVLNLMDQERLESFASGLRSAERLSLLGNVARGIAHEVRNPLSSIRGLAQLLSSREDLPSEKVRSYGDIMTKEVDRVDRVVQRLYVLGCSHSEEKEMVLLADLFETVLEMAAHKARSKNIHLDFDCADDSTALFGCRQPLVQALLNVVVNGIEAAPEGGWVKIRVKSVNGLIEIRVENNGPSIPPNELENIFQPFHTTKSNGSGLGLTITESVIRDHGGDVTIESCGDRTIVTLTIPLEGTRTAEKAFHTGNNGRHDLANQNESAETGERHREGLPA